MVDFPDGVIPVVEVLDPLTTNRLTTYTYELLDSNENLKGPLDGVKRGGSLTWRRDAVIKGGGQITVMDLGQDIDWLSDRIRISTTVNGVTWPLGVWIPTAPVEQWAGTRRTWTVDLHDKLTVLNEDGVVQTYYVDTDDDVLDAVLALIASAGESLVSATDIGATVESPMMWLSGTPKLTIINDLLNASGYFPLRVDRNGVFVIEPYVQPHDRPFAYEFLDGAQSIYSDTFTRGLDNFAVPNRIIATTNGTEWVEGWIASAENEDPDSPYSYVNRGRWITRSYDNIDSVDVAALATWCKRKLADWSNPSATEKFAFMPVPIDIYDAVRFRNVAATIDVRTTVEVVTVPLDGTALASAEVREVAEITTTTGTDVWSV